jgi:hypothetical protein
MNELLMVIFVVLFAVIGGFIVIDVWFDFRPSRYIRKFFGG